MAVFPAADVCCRLFYARGAEQRMAMPMKLSSVMNIYCLPRKAYRHTSFRPSVRKKRVGAAVIGRRRRRGLVFNDFFIFILFYYIVFVFVYVFNVQITVRDIGKPYHAHAKDGTCKPRRNRSCFRLAGRRIGSILVIHCSDRRPPEKSEHQYPPSVYLICLWANVRGLQTLVYALRHCTGTLTVS
jgi:hypothetical protein